MCARSVVRGVGEPLRRGGMRARPPVRLASMTPKHEDHQRIDRKRHDTTVALSVPFNARRWSAVNTPSRKYINIDRLHCPGAH